MGTSLNGLTPAATYQGLIKFGDNSQISATQRYLSDGLGNDLPIAVSSTKVGIGATTGTSKLYVKGDGTTSSTYSLILDKSDGNTSFAVRDDAQSIFYGGAAMNFYTSSQYLNIKGSGTTSGTYNTNITNSTGTSLLRVRDDGNVGIGTTSPASLLHVNGNVTIGNVGSTSPSEPLMVKTATAFYFPAIKVEDYNTEQGLYMQTIIGLNAGVGTGRYYNSGAWRSDVTNPTNIRFDGGIIRFYAQSGVTADADYTPSERMCITSTGNVGIGTNSPNTSAKLDVSSTTQGFLPPRMTTTQKNAITTPAAGLMVFDTTLAKLCVYSGTAWETITSV